MTGTLQFLCLEATFIVLQKHLRQETKSHASATSERPQETEKDKQDSTGFTGSLPFQHLVSPGFHNVTHAVEYVSERKKTRKKEVAISPVELYK